MLFPLPVAGTKSFVGYWNNFSDISGCFRAHTLYNFLYGIGNRLPHILVYNIVASFIAENIDENVVAYFFCFFV